MIKLRKILLNKGGSSTPLIVAIVLVIIILSSAAFEYMRLMIVAMGIRDAVQSSIIDVATENWDEVYNGLREGYSGGYTLTGSSWTENISTGNIYERLEENLSVVQEGDKYIKYAGSNLEYAISNLYVDVKNAPLAPSDVIGTNQFTVEGTVHITMPLSFGWEHLPNVKFKLKLKAGYVPKF
ncbi:hypothetical protein [Acetivibrio cellulolyticus]|uniref:hypothetical protein n=1 Tax=Acetivibrio cellulolyticus TaxID=35830 RepID=UPI0001E2C75C|nr:hypothetical protein [Acetivibrio cellulolyticus]